MKLTHLFRLFVLTGGVLVAPAAFAGLIISAPVDVIGNLPAARFTMAGYGTRAYKDWGNEPFVAVNPLNRDGAVLVVEQDPVEAEVAQHLDHGGRGEGAHDAEGSLPGVEPLLERVLTHAGAS
jgi:hypothetical protein